MSTENTTRTPEEFAQNYRTFGNGVAGPVAIANINVFDKTSGSSEAYDSQKHDATIKQIAIHAAKMKEAKSQEDRDKINAEFGDMSEGYKGYPFTSRTFVNLAMKTEKSNGKNAVITQPIGWALKYRTGDYVAVEIVNGWAAKLLPATVLKAREITSPAVNKAVAEAVQKEQSEAQAATKEEPAEAKPVEVEAEADEDSPF